MKHAPYVIIAVFNDLEKNFLGNTAAVVLLKREPDRRNMQAMAADFNQPATTYLWPSDMPHQYHVRWFAPDSEIDLCGHGTLAAIAFLSSKLNINDTITLVSSSGTLRGKLRKNGTCAMEIAAIPVIEKLPVPSLLLEALNISLSAYYTTNNKHIVLAENEASIAAMQPDFAMLRRSKTFGYVITAPGDHVDFVSRTLVPHVQQLEDHATGSSHAALVPFWAERLQKNVLQANQLSPRGGHFQCEIEGKTVTLSGQYKLIAEGKIY